MKKTLIPGTIKEIDQKSEPEYVTVEMNEFEKNKANKDLKLISMKKEIAEFRLQDAKDYLEKRLKYDIMQAEVDAHQDIYEKELIFNQEEVRYKEEIKKVEKGTVTFPKEIFERIKEERNNAE